MADFTLTTGADTVTGTAADDTVNGTAATLNSGDSLTGGAGTDTLALYGSGTFRVDQLATFTGFEIITLNNFTSVCGDLYLGSQSIAVTGYGSGASKCTWEVARSRSREAVAIDNVYSTSASNWNAGNSIDGGSSRQYIYLNWNGSDNAVYDLTTNTLSHINYLCGYGANLTVKINSAVAGGVANFYGNGTNAKLVTSDAALDLSHSTVSGFTVASSNATGTNFTVHDIGTAFQVAGGSGTDTLTAQGFVFSADQRNAIFATASVERIVDASGTYTVSVRNRTKSPRGTARPANTAALTARSRVLTAATPTAGARNTRLVRGRQIHIDHRRRSAFPLTALNSLPTRAAAARQALIRPCRYPASTAMPSSRNAADGHRCTF